MDKLRQAASAGLCLLAALTAHGAKPAQTASCAPLPSLRAMKEAGDAVRAMYPLDVDPKSPQAEKAADRVMLVDRQNTAQLRPWLRRCGWPSVKIHGAEVEGLVWVLIQHADQDRSFQLFAIGLLKRRVLEGDAPGSHLAYLEDRVAIGMGQPQRYGTQAEQKGPCRVELLPVDDLARVAKRRRDAGLDPLDKYIAQLRSALLPPSCGIDGQLVP
jgi:hypothetical protein